MASDPDALAARWGTVAVVAPHPDDETLGLGGTLLRLAAAGYARHWIIGTRMTPDVGYAESEISERDREIAAVAEAYGFDSFRSLPYATTRLDTVGKSLLVGSLKSVLADLQPETLFLPFAHDAHSDHRELFEAGAAAAKWFALPSLRRVIAYETPSETGQYLDPAAPAFKPNLYVEIDAYLGRKIEIMKVYKSEIRAFPFPRSPDAIAALARWRGSECGAMAAEAFWTLRETL